MAFPIIMAIKQRAAQKRGKVAAAKERAGGGDTPKIPGTITDSMDTDSYRRGGKVKRTGLAKVHKGERVLTRAQAKRYKRRGGSKR